MQEVLDLQLAVQMRDDHLAECQRQSEVEQQQIDDLERQILMQVSKHCCSRGSTLENIVLRRSAHDSVAVFVCA